MAKNLLIVFVKAPRPGEVKTRLAQMLGPKPACEAYIRLVEFLLNSLKSLDSLQIRFAPNDGFLEIMHWKLNPKWKFCPQGFGDLGERMNLAFEEELTRNADQVVLIGSDTPEISPDEIQEAFDELQSKDLVLGPAKDGGYWLIGLNKPQPELFQDIPWSSAQVLEATLQKAEQLDLHTTLLREKTDVDTEAEWLEFVKFRS